MATFVGQITDRQIIFVAQVSVAGELDGNPYASYALLDTGAQVSMISDKVVQDVGLVPIGYMDIVPVTGESTPTEKFRIRLDIPITSEISLPGGVVAPHNVVSGMELEVGKLPYSPTNYDILLGMDFLTGFHVTMYGGNYILSN